MNFDAAVAGVVFIIIAALVVTNPAGDKAVLSSGGTAITSITNSLQKGVK